MPKVVNTMMSQCWQSLTSKIQHGKKFHKYFLGLSNKKNQNIRGFKMSQPSFTHFFLHFCDTVLYNCIMYNQIKFLTWFYWGLISELVTLNTAAVVLTLRQNYIIFCLSFPLSTVFWYLALVVQILSLK